MAHPQMFDEDDPYLERVRQLCGALPGTAEKLSHGRPAFFTKKVFAYYGASLKVNGEWVQHPHSIVVLPDEEDRRALLDDPRTFVPAYLGPSGWIGLDLDDLDLDGVDLDDLDPDGVDLGGVDLGLDAEWTEVAELLDASFRLTAPKRAIAELDARSG